MDNLELYNKVREVPDTAQKPIQAGRLKGMTDINPMWRIKMLTEQFGPCGIGWYYEIVDKHLDTITDSKEIVATVEIKLYVKDSDGEWSKPISGIGGSKIASMERNGLYTDDEAYKKASTDALSVACKNLGIGADVYWASDNDKYIDKGRENFNKSASTSNSKASTPRASASSTQKMDERKEIVSKISARAREQGITDIDVSNKYHINKSTPIERLKEVLADMEGQMPNFEAIDEPVPWRK